MTDNRTARQDHLDCVHGLMILHMMFYHLCGSTIYSTPYYYPIIHTLSFFMAWFFFKSGMLYKERTLREVIQRGFKRLIIPAIFFTLIGYLCYLIAKRPDTSFAEEIDYIYVIGAVKGNGPTWFLLSLYAVQILYGLMHNCKLTPIMIVFLSLILLFTNKYLGLRPLWAYNIPLGLLFYSLGHLLKDHQYNRIIIIFCIIIYSGLYFVHSEIDFLFGRFKPFVIVIPWTLAGCILINVLFKSFPRLCMAPLRFFGRHAMEFLGTHMIIITIMEGFLLHYELNFSSVLFEFTIFAIYLISLSLILHFFKLRKIQWMLGRSVPQ